MTRTDSYICTLSTYDEEKIEAVRQLVRSTNLLNKLVSRRDRWGRPVRYRLTIKPRLGRNSPYSHLYREGGPLHRYSSQDVKREHGARFDLYLHRR
jgi:hypothetical protein